MSLPPVVYVGPTVGRRTVKKWLPDAQVMPPVRRGDLYRDRLLGFSIFLILDGAFFERLAVSPREIIDVIRDGGTVFGASSMGAIRAADCWPAGMRGVGSIYRLYRRGVLISDDEVAVAFAARSPFRATTVPLVNVRYAVGRAVRDGICSRAHGESIVQTAYETHFSERDWTSIVRSAIPGDAGNVLKFVQARDLKQIDAVRALKAVRDWPRNGADSAAEGDVLSSGLVSRIHPRERSTYPRAGPTRVESGDFWRWLLATGRYRRYATGLADAVPSASYGDRSPGRRRRRADANSEAAACAEASSEVASWLSADLKAVTAALARKRSSPSVLATLLAHESRFASAVLADMSVAGDTEAIILRRIAVRRAADESRKRNLQPSDRDWYLARSEIACNHGFRTWRDLRDSHSTARDTWEIIEKASEELALAKRFRYELFIRPRR